MKDIQKVTNNQTPFVQALAQFPKALGKYVDTWPETEKDNTIIRVSGCHDLCPRQFVLDYWEPKGSKTFPFTSSMMAGMGTYLHSYIQEVILGPLGILKGAWKNNITGEVHVGYYPGNGESFYDQYLRTGRIEYSYVENTVEETHYRFVGHQDGIMSKERILAFMELMGNGKADFSTIRKEISAIPKSEEICFELKSSGDRVFEMASAANLPQYYKMQANIYQELSDIPETLFWYINRNTCDSKMFLYPFDDRIWQEACRKADITWRSIRDEVLPESEMKCLSIKDKRAQECPQRHSCWARMNFKEWVQKQKEKQPERKWLDLSNYDKVP